MSILTILSIAWIDYKNIMLYTKSNTVKVSIQDSGQGSRISNVVVCVLYHFLFYVNLVYTPPNPENRRIYFFTNISAVVKATFVSSPAPGCSTYHTCYGLNCLAGNMLDWVHARRKFWIPSYSAAGHACNCFLHMQRTEKGFVYPS